MERFGGIERLRTAELGRLMAARSQRGQMDVVSMGCATYQLLADEFETDIAFANAIPACSSTTGCSDGVPTRAACSRSPAASRCHS